MNEERIVFMQLEDRQVTCERENGETIVYALALVPPEYKEGDIIKAIVHDASYIEFISLDIDAMKERAERVGEKRRRLGRRIRRKFL